MALAGCMKIPTCGIHSVALCCRPLLAMSRNSLTYFTFVHMLKTIHILKTNQCNVSPFYLNGHVKPMCCECENQLTRTVCVVVVCSYLYLQLYKHILFGYYIHVRSSVIYNIITNTVSFLWFANVLYLW